MSGKMQVQAMQNHTVTPLAYTCYILLSYVLVCSAERKRAWLQAPWTVFVLDLSASSSVQTTSSSVKQEQETTGQRDTTLRGLSWLTQFWMWFERRLKVVIAFKDFSFAIPLVEALVQAWEPCWSLRCEKSTQIVSWKHSPWFLRQRCRTRWWNHTTHLWICLKGTGL